MVGLPTGTVTFLFTDIEGSTRLLQHVGDTRGAEVFEEHHRLLREGIVGAGGYLLQDQGDGFLFVFQRAQDGLRAAVAAQTAIAGHPWPDGTSLRVRMALHTGEPIITAEGYVGVDIHRAARICAVGSGGQILVSQTTHALIERDLPDGFGLRDLGTHRLKDLQRPEKLYQVLHAGLTAEFPALRSLDALPNNLPFQVTSFVGRDREMAEVRRVLPTTRVLTLTGAGGSGKSRLALQAAADLLEEFADGVWLVELAPLTDPALVPQAVASTLHVSEQPGRPLTATLLDYLKEKHMLLMVDNCEHLITACAQLVDMLIHQCRHLRILATSREALGIAGETTFPVPSLTLPDVRRLPPLESLREFEAVRLFIDRANAALPAFQVTDRNAHAVAQVCHRLDGIPLAIELAAARVKMLSPEEIAKRLDDRFRLLTGGSRTALPRHQTLQAAMDWSYNLLSDQEGRLLRRLSVFAGGFSLDAAEAICAGDGLEAWEILDLITRLVDKSLVVAQGQNGETRYRQLETVRQYCRDRLVEAGESEPTRDRHMRWFVELAERAGPELYGPNEEIWLDRLEREHDNMRAALEWALGGRDADIGVRLAAALGRFWDMRDYRSEAREWLEKALSSTSGPSAARPAALFYLAATTLYSDRSMELLEETRRLARETGDTRREAWSCIILGDYYRYSIGDFSRAALLMEEGRAIARAAGDRNVIAFATRFLGRLAAYRGDFTTAKALLEESLGLYREIGFKSGISGALVFLSVLALRQGETATAEAFLRESMELRSKLQFKAGVGGAVLHLGLTALSQGDPDRAMTLFKESLAAFHAAGDKFTTAGVLSQLGLTARYMGEYARAQATLEEALRDHQAIGDRAGAAMTLRVLGTVASDQGDYDTAVRLIEESLSISREVGHELFIANALLSLGIVARLRGDYARAEALCEQSRGLFKRKADIADVVAELGDCRYESGDLDSAAELNDQALATYRELNNKTGIAGCLVRLGSVAYARGEVARAVSLLEEGTSLFRDMRFPQGLAMGLAEWASVLRGQDDLSRAEALCRESLTLRARMGIKRGIARSLEVMAAIEVRRGRSERAAGLLGAAETIRRVIGAPLPPVERPEYEQTVAAIQDALGGERLATLLAAGRAMSIDQAVELALNTELSVRVKE